MGSGLTPREARMASAFARGGLALSLVRLDGGLRQLLVLAHILRRTGSDERLPLVLLGRQTA
eukprot:5707450-Alexandrium_andersonii.AAC.1